MPKAAAPFKLRRASIIIAALGNDPEPTQHRVDAERSGLLAVHRGIGMDFTSWVVTHIPTGMRFNCFERKQDAIDFVAILSPLNWDFTDISNIDPVTHAKAIQTVRLFQTAGQIVPSWREKQAITTEGLHLVQPSVFRSNRLAKTAGGAR